METKQNGKEKVSECKFVILHVSFLFCFFPKNKLEAVLVGNGDLAKQLLHNNNRAANHSAPFIQITYTLINWDNLLLGTTQSDLSTTQREQKPNNQVSTTCWLNKFTTHTQTDARTSTMLPPVTSERYFNHTYINEPMFLRNCSECSRQSAAANTCDDFWVFPSRISIRREKLLHL